MPQAALSGSIVAVLRPQIRQKRPLGRLIGGRGQGRFGQRELAAPTQFVIDKVAQAPRVVGRGGLMPGGVGPNARGEAGIEDVGELAPISLAAFQRPAAAVDRDHVRRLPHLIDRGLRPVADRVHAPASQAAMQHVMELPPPIVAVLPLEIRRREIIGLVALAVIVVVRRPDDRGRRTCPAANPWRAGRQTTARGR